jgi:hypothetical protein
MMATRACNRSAVCTPTLASGWRIGIGDRFFPSGATIYLGAASPNLVAISCVAFNGCSPAAPAGRGQHPRLTAPR